MTTNSTNFQDALKTEQHEKKENFIQSKKLLENLKTYCNFFCKGEYYLCYIPSIDNYTILDLTIEDIKKLKTNTSIEILI